MSVHTESDEKLLECRDHIEKAYDCLLVVLNTKTWGHADYDVDFIRRAQKVLIKLHKLKQKM